MSSSILRFFHIMLAALLAGTSFGIWMGFDPVDYSVATYIEQQQQMVQSLNALMVSMVIIVTVLSFISAYLHRQNTPDFILLLVAGAAFMVCIFTTRFGNLPIQEAMLQWTPEAHPENWKTLRDDWWYYHIRRTQSELLGLALICWVYVKPTIQNKFKS